MQLSGSGHKNNRSMSTGLKPATAVRLKSLPWNLAPINYEVATTATSHSRRTTENMPIHKQFQYNLQSLEGTKPSTSSATGNHGQGYQYATLDGLAQQSNLTRSKEDDVFSNLTQGNNLQTQQTPTNMNKIGGIQPLYLSGQQSLMDNGMG